jgi:hypothetical protein
VAEVKPFRAVRYGERAGSLETLVAPPYDVISAAERDELAARNPRNVVHLTLPEDEADAGRTWRSWREDGTLADEAEPRFWWLSQDYVGPDGVGRTREGLVAALKAEPYANRVVLPHERTHRGPKEGVCGSSARPGRSSSRCSSSTRARRRLSARTGSPTSRSRASGSGASRRTASSRLSPTGSC